MLEIHGQQTRDDRGREVGRLEHDGDAACAADAHDPVHRLPDRQVEDAGEVAGREHVFPLEQAADGQDALADGVLEKAAQLARILAQFRFGDERATALATHDQVALDQPVHRRADRHAADAELAS